MSDAHFSSTSSRGRGRQLLAILALLAGGAQWPLATAADRPAAFNVSAAQMQALGIQVQRLDGRTAQTGLAYPARVVLPPRQQQLIAAPLAGVIDQLLVAENEPVAAGQAVARLLSPDLGELQLRLMESASRQTLADRALARERELLAEGIIAERRVQEADANALEARARRQQAEAALRLAGLDETMIRRLAGGAQAPQSSMTLRARAAGVVTELSVKPGQRVQSSDPLMQLADTRLLWLDIQVPVGRQDEVATAADADVAVVGRDGVRAAVLSKSAGVGDGQTFVVRAEVRKGAAQLRPGEYVQAQLAFAAAKGWVVPIEAVARDDGKAYVFVRSADGFIAKPVEILATGGKTLRVQGPLETGQQIAVSSVIALKAAWQGKGGGE